jgi:hypothetical protein
MVTTPPASAVALDGKREALRRASRRAAPDAALIVIEVGSILVRIGRVPRRRQSRRSCAC